MARWLRRARGAVGMGVTWAVGWALFGLLIGVTSVFTPWLPWDAFFGFFDAPLPALAVPGFVGGALFSFVLGVIGRRRRFDELSLAAFTAWGAFGGLLLSLVPATMVGVGLATLGRDEFGVWDITAVIALPLILLCAASAAGSLLLARRGERAFGETAHALELGAETRRAAGGAQHPRAALERGRVPDVLTVPAGEQRDPVAGVVPSEVDDRARGS